MKLYYHPDNALPFLENPNDEAFNVFQTDEIVNEFDKVYVVAEKIYTTSFCSSCSHSARSKSYKIVFVYPFLYENNEEFRHISDKIPKQYDDKKFRWFVTDVVKTYD